MTKQSILPAIYIIANRKLGTLYTGVTSDLIKRIAQHKQGDIKGFTSQHECKRLVYFEMHETMEAAIFREKQLKGGSRNRKIALIESLNPAWDDLFDKLL